MRFGNLAYHGTERRTLFRETPFNVLCSYIFDSITHFQRAFDALAQSQTETILQLSVRDQVIQDAHKDAETDVNRPIGS